MAIHYGDAHTRKWAIKFAPGLVRAWALFDYARDRECVFFETVDGRLYTKGWARFSHSFDDPNFFWYQIRNIPAHAEYIGMHNPPRNVQERY